MRDRVFQAGCRLPLPPLPWINTRIARTTSLSLSLVWLLSPSFSASRSPSANPQSLFVARALFPSLLHSPSLSCVHTFLSFLPSSLQSVTFSLRPLHVSSRLSSLSLSSFFSIYFHLPSTLYFFLAIALSLFLSLRSHSPSLFLCFSPRGILGNFVYFSFLSSILFLNSTNPFIFKFFITSFS